VQRPSTVVMIAHDDDTSDCRGFQPTRIRLS
jgi:hypothetical protein